MSNISILYQNGGTGGGKEPQSSTSTGPTPSPPIVWILFGWTGSKLPELKPFAECILKSDEDNIKCVLTTSTNACTLAYSESGVKSAVIMCLNEVESAFPEAMIVFMFQSDGGGVHFYGLLQLLESGERPTLQSKIAGIVFDSAPSPNKVSLFAKGLVPDEKFGLLGQPLKWIARGGVYVMMGLPTITTARRRAAHYPKCVFENTLMVPELYIWSETGDALIPHDHMTALVAQRKVVLEGSSSTLHTHVLKHSGHVDHLKNDPAGYQKVVNEFSRAVRERLLAVKGV
eukprot:PhF_6_TR35749/c0_g1_i2/m.51917